MTRAACNLIIQITKLCLSYRSIKVLKRRSSPSSSSSPSPSLPPDYDVDLHAQHAQHDNSKDEKNHLTDHIHQTQTQTQPQCITDSDLEILQLWSLIAFLKIYDKTNLESILSFIIPLYYYFKLILILITVIPSTKFPNFWSDVFLIPVMYKVHEWISLLDDVDWKEVLKREVVLLPWRILDLTIVPGLLCDEEMVEVVRRKRLKQLLDAENGKFILFHFGGGGGGGEHKDREDKEEEEGVLENDNEGYKIINIDEFDCGQHVNYNNNHNNNNNHYIHGEEDYDNKNNINDTLVTVIPQHNHGATLDMIDENPSFTEITNLNHSSIPTYASPSKSFSPTRSSRSSKSPNRRNRTSPLSTKTSSSPSSSPSSKSPRSKKYTSITSPVARSRVAASSLHLRKFQRDHSTCRPSSTFICESTKNTKNYNRSSSRSPKRNAKAVSSTIASTTIPPPLSAFKSHRISPGRKTNDHDDHNNTHSIAQQQEINDINSVNNQSLIDKFNSVLDEMEEDEDKLNKMNNIINSHHHHKKESLGQRLRHFFTGDTNIRIRDCLFDLDLPSVPSRDSNHASPSKTFESEQVVYSDVNNRVYDCGDDDDISTEEEEEIVDDHNDEKKKSSPSSTTTTLSTKKKQASNKNAVSERNVSLRRSRRLAANNKKRL